MATIFLCFSLFLFNIFLCFLFCPANVYSSVYSESQSGMMLSTSHYHVLTCHGKYATGHQWALKPYPQGNSMANEMSYTFFYQFDIYSKLWSAAQLSTKKQILAEHTHLVTEHKRQKCRWQPLHCLTQSQQT